MNKLLRIFVGIIAVLVLVAIRARAPQLFYDPLIAYFKSGHLSQSLPQIELWKWGLHMGARFWLNSVISLLLLWALFQKRGVLLLSSLLYIVLFIVAMVLLIVLLHLETPSTGVIFYVRRFLIHPVLVLLLIPAFYFQQR
ncbi:exosortase F system-associated membrane protein [Altibacter sp. HG106]|uniref:exosortase F system-associated membrane protein n=1 Tax=Altibacter sp. HG106 TaxID=3023937 RepID=UPI0023509EEB|nr:exosortase F system-associated protein [Altibacter sp. HG106]MDC7994296.1 exosortase F system-associated protein [Altibacter sp. HG106]